MKHAFILFILFLVSACSGSIDGKNYEQTGQPFDLFTFFEGDVKAWGIVQDRDGNLLQRFEVDIKGKIDGNTLTLDETFYYSIGNGPTERTWTISKQIDNTYTGSATDIPGPASGKGFGNAFNWRYNMDLPVDNTSYNVTFDDWIWAFDEDRIINRSYIKKFGIVWSDVTIFMEKK
ncbi:DUF3833 domain-containing protein [Kordiimonas sp. SCSIO 12610]|uniref:DUF3833 domain-containing protein n=1 Tax=Kordiimonas sp. SCSIO 12610 TaxID=2829597 RepID=UPI00210CECFD|nr:DUF3833 domain-containing protein [Kordiimonas sp. SCSIO 12610]UTW54760.1 DUF3833 domain-containing protein [Kordiimonas sp. SCSIO 12610]